MLKLHPPAHSVPDNFWHTLLIGVVASFFIMQTGQNIIELFLRQSPVTLIEQQLLAGQGHPVTLWLASLADAGHPLLWNRILAATGWLFSLSLIVRALKPQLGFVGALPTWILLFTLPGFSVWMCAAGSGSWAVYFFLKGYYTLSGHEKKTSLIRGGAMTALAVLIQPLWILPSLGLLIGCWEAFRTRLKWAALGFIVAGTAGILLFVLWIPGGGSTLWLGPAHASATHLSVGLFLQRYLLLVINGVLLVVYGARRRGIGWWSLVLTLPLLMLEPLLASGLETVLIPLWIFSALGLPKLPVLLDVRFPRVYQSVFLCQLLLWLPAYLGTRPLHLYLPLP